MAQNIPPSSQLSSSRVPQHAASDALWLINDISREILQVFILSTSQGYFTYILTMTILGYRIRPMRQKQFDAVINSKPSFLMRSCLIHRHASEIKRTVFIEQFPPDLL